MAKPHKYERIMQRIDKRRPETLAEFFRKHEACKECFVMNIKLLTPESGEMQMSWSEKDADAMAKRALNDPK